MKRKLLAAALFLGVVASAGAEIVPTPGASDQRVKWVNFDTTDVVRIVGHYGFSTHVRFGEGESVASIALGDSLAWEVAPAGNHLFVKPREENAVTNMTVVTSPRNRAYQFVLTAHESQNGASPRPNDMYFKVAFRYPEEERARAERERQLAETNRLLEEGQPEVRNYEYWGCGSDGLMPDSAYDDGRFTYLRFSANRDMPAVFEELPGGQEALINTHVDGDTIVVHRVVSKLVLRKGAQVSCIQNRAFNPHGISTPSGTVNPAVERVITGGSNE